MHNRSPGNLKICSRCILPETFPGIKFDDQGICNYCRKEQKALQKSVEKKAQYRRRLDDLINDIKGKAPLYDAVMAYSGGKALHSITILCPQWHGRI
ncbi:MAG: hypothetical protein JRI90_13095 [Deltaproteobacteria bacterium]|nr:hypothetical protein [Deltaproteobacteria bacterium]